MENHLDIKFLRIENNLDMVHFFYPDELVYGVKMACKINQKDIGSICCCYPAMVVEDKENVWATA